jgi:hypothetical protein
VSAGYPVAIGVYVNEYLFYDNTNPQAGSEPYDHIVPVTGFSSHHPIGDGIYYAKDVITFNDNGEWYNNGSPPYVFSYEARSFEQTRENANSPSGAIYSLPKDGVNYGLAVTGIMDTYHDTVPTPEPVTLTVTVSGLKPGVSYTLYRYTSFNAVPNDHFNANAGNAYESWPISVSSGSTSVITEDIMSDEMAIYRAVPNSAP